jgi:hypothetical protein
VGLRALGEALHEWKPTQTAAVDPISVIRAAWAEIVGGNIAANSRPAEIERDALMVVTRSNAWSQQLSFLSEKIVEALAARGVQPRIARLRFRVGKIAPAAVKRAVRAQKRMESSDAVVEGDTVRIPAKTAEEAMVRFREDVEGFWRAKRAAGWKECTQCGALIAPSARALCSTCAHAQVGDREGMVARLLYEVPWLGYDGVVKLVAGLTRGEYDGIRDRLLKRWWETLRRARYAGRLSRDGHERLVASSYVLLKSGIAPERIAPATVRNILGAELHDLIYQQPAN